jgi:hypothetical protein
MPALVLAALAGSLLAPGSVKCTGSSMSTDELLTRARPALALAGTEQVTAGTQPGCITIAVRSAGTARLVELVLRGVKVPAESVDFRVNERPVSLR